MLVFGIVLGLPGTVLGLPETAAELGLSLTGRGWLIAALFMGLLIGCLASGRLVDVLGYRAALATSAALVAVMMPLFALARTSLQAGAAITALGIAAAGVNTASNALSSDLFPRERARRMNRLAILAGIGGLTMPVATVLASPALSWRTVVMASAALAALVAVACIRVPHAHVRSSQTHSMVHGVRLFVRQPGFVWLAVALLLGGGVEASMAGWTSTYLQASGVNPSTATWVLSSHWLGLILARVMLSPRVEESKATAITWSALCGALSVAIFLVFTARVWLVVAPFVIGVAIALVVPTLLALAGDRYRGNSGALFGLLLTLLQVGGIALPAAIGIVSDEAGLPIGLSLIVMSSLGVAVATPQGTRHPA